MILAKSDSIVEGFWREEVVKRGASERISVPGGMVVLAMRPLPLLGMSERVKRADSAGGVEVVMVVEGDMLVAVVIFCGIMSIHFFSRHTQKKNRAPPWPTALGRGSYRVFQSSLGTGEFFPLFSAISSIGVRLSVGQSGRQGRQNSSRKKVASLPKCGHQFLSGYIT